MKQFNFFKSRLMGMKRLIETNLTDSSSKAMNLTNKLSIRNRLIFFFLLVSLGPMLIVGTISYISSRSAINSKIAKYSQKGLSQTIQNLEIKLQGIEDISTQFIAVPQYNTILKEYVEAQDSFDMVTKGRAVDDLIQSIAFSHNENGSILFMSIHDPTQFVVSNSLDLSSDWLRALRKSQFYKNILNQHGRAVWSPVKLNHKDTQIAMGRVINEPNVGQPLGVMIIFLQENILSNTINAIMGSNIESNITNDFTMIVDNTGLIMFSPFPKDIDKNISTLLSSPRKIRPLLTDEKDNDSFLVKLKNWQVRIIGQKIGDRNWYILNVAKTSYLYSESNLVGLLTLCLGVFFGIIAIVISIAIALSISNPLNQVIDAMQRAEKGDLTVRANIKRQDELGFLGVTFDRMIQYQTPG